MAHGSGGEFGDRTLLIALHTETAPSDEEWGTWIAFIEPFGLRTQQDLHRCPNLVLTDGGAPSTAHRTAANVLISQAETMPPVAVVTASIAVRTLLRGLSIFNPRVRSFAPTELDAALTHLGVPLSARGAVIARCRAIEQAHGMNVRTLRAVS
jgi:hypothetical protein